MITLSNYKQLVITANDIQKQDIRLMQEYVKEEVARQNAIANQTKTSCLEKLTDLQEQLEQVDLSFDHCYLKCFNYFRILIT